MSAILVAVHSIVLATSSPLPPVIQSFLGGLLVALALLAFLAHRSLRDPILSQAGLFGLAAAGAWITFTGVLGALLPQAWAPGAYQASLVFGALGLVAWWRMASNLVAASPAAGALAASPRFMALPTGFIALLAILPWGSSHRLSAWSLGLLGPVVGGLTLAAGLRARKDGLRTASPLVAATLALLTACAALWAMAFGAQPPLVGMATLQVSLVVLTGALGGALVNRMAELRHLSAADGLAAAARQAQDLEALVQQRSAELSERLRDLSEARRTTELVNQSLQRALDQLERVAATDRLTGAWNRRRFEEAVISEIALVHRRREPLSLIMFDLDHFKRVNDTFGHSAGDAVLVGVTQRVRQHLRASDALIRWGGEEFLVMAPATRLPGAAGLAEKLRAAVEATDFPDIGRVTMSLGVAEYMLGEGLEEWIDRTDRALYQAKSEGRNRVVRAPAPEGEGLMSMPKRSLLEIIWEESDECGHPLIDDQHQRLFQMANALMTLLTQDRPISEVQVRLDMMLAHSAQHFHDEEGILRGLRFPDLAHHAAIHGSLLEKARQLQADVQKGQLDFGKLITFLAMDLIKGHILTEDRGYFAHLATSLAKGAAPQPGA